MDSDKLQQRPDERDQAQPPVDATTSADDDAEEPREEIKTSLSLPDIPTSADLNDLELAISSVVGTDPTEEETKLHKRASSVLKLTQENEKLRAELKAMTERIEAAERRKAELRQRAPRTREQHIMEPSAT